MIAVQGAMTWTCRRGPDDRRQYMPAEMVTTLSAVQKDLRF
ncbi:hypothetical protein [Vibrio phage vB_VpaS_AL-2]|nr:hypothetical protein [Vibrio phage vB_VpaS_AL-2]